MLSTATAAIAAGILSQQDLDAAEPLEKLRCAQQKCEDLPSRIIPKRYHTSPSSQILAVKAVCSENTIFMVTGAGNRHQGSILKTWNL